MGKKGTTLAASLKRHREAAGLTQQGLAVAAGLSVGIVSQTEQGASKDPRISTLSALARALEVSLDALLDGTEWEVRR
jgi:transcriptional regulator with XRE-family HTH domain